MTGAVPPLPELLREIVGSSLPPRIAFMRLAMAAGSTEDLMALLRSTDAPGVAPIRAVADAHPEGWQTVSRIMALADHGSLPTDPAARILEVARLFDDAVAVSPEASVALYSLGNSGALAEATREIVGWLQRCGIVNPSTRILDFGCGIGRLAAALAPLAHAVTAVDVSAAMLAEATTRCAALHNIDVRRIGGLDLAPFADQGFGAVVALDSMPYVAGHGDGLGRRMLDEMARVLEPDGHLAILNYSYRGDAAADVAEIEAFAMAAGFEPLTMGERPFSGWDGTAFHLRKL
jgi:SAM-dependent methyltransferase